MKYLMMIFVALLLTACGDKVDSDSTDTTDTTDTAAIAAGKTLYESSELNCSTCHGVDGQSNEPIDLFTDSYSREGDDQAYSLAEYIELFMPTSDPALCDADCASDIAAYLVSLAAETDEIVVTSELKSVVSRLTNDEYTTALIDMLELTEGNQATLRENVELSAEIELGGLVSAAERQQLSHLTFSKFLDAATEASRLVLYGERSLALKYAYFNDRIACSDNSMSLDECIRDRGIAYMEKGFRGQETDADITALDELLETFDELELTTSDGEALGGLDRKVLRYQAVVQFVALSPKFATIYEKGVESEEVNSERPLTEDEIANRLAFFITGTGPDAILQTAADDELLNSSEERQSQAVRLVSGEDSSDGVANIMKNWLGIDEEIADAESIIEAETFVTQWIEEGRPFSDIYTSPVAVNNTSVDGEDNVTEEPFGALGLEAVVASNTNPPVASFINRGEFVVEELLCGILPLDLPEEAVEGDEELLEDPVEVFEVHAQEDCATCHKIFDNYGAAFQRFDSLTSLYNPGDDWLGTDFELYPIGDISGTVSDVAELGQVIGASRQAHTCFANLWYRHAMRRDLLTADDNEDEVIIDGIVDEWMAGDTSVQSLLELISGHDTFTTLYR